MDIPAYCRRIGYAGPLAPTASVLRALARQHATGIPFENVGVLASGPPSLALDAIEAKLVHARRGGYCYEQNALLQAALVECGFAVTGLSARVRYGVPAGLPTPRSHMVLCVETAEGRFLVDAGFGGLTLTAPVALRWNEEQATPHETVRLVPADQDHLLQACIGGTWIDVYRFDFSPQTPADYSQQNWHTATRPGALFAHNLVAAMPTASGRITVFNRTLTHRSLHGEVRRQPLDDAAALGSALETLFSIQLSAAELATAWEVSGHGQPAHPGFS